MNEFVFKSALSRMAILNVHDQYHDWYYNKFLVRDHIPYYPLFVESHIEKNGTVHPKEVVGSTHPSYEGLSWIEFLGCIKRFEKVNHIDSASKALDMIHKSDRYSSDITFNKYGDLLFVCYGNHRTCLARFLSQKITNVTITHYRIDESKFHLAQELHNRNIDITRFNNFFWRIKLGNQSFDLNIEDILFFIDYYDSISMERRKSLSEKLFSRNKKSDHPFKFYDYELLDSEIKRHYESFS